MSLSSGSNINRWISQAFKESLSGRHKDQLIGAILMRGGSVIARTSNLSRPFGECNRGFHAEERILRHRHAKGCTLIVVRSNGKGQLSTMSRPCKKCFPLVQSSGVKKIIYVDWSGEIVVERVKN